MNELIYGLFIVVISLGISGFFSYTETAVTSISDLKAQHLKETGGRAAQVLNLWLKHPSRVLASVLIGNNLVNIFASIYIDEIIRQQFGSSSVFLVTIAMTIAIVLFAEIIPKTIAKSYAVKTVIPALNIFRIFYFFLWPFAAAMSAVGNLAHKVIAMRDKTPNPQITEEELEFLIDIGEKEGVLAEQKHEMLSGVFELGDTVVREIMVHRIDLTALSQSVRIIDSVDKFRETGLSRIPIYEDKIDNVIGTIHVKDALFFIKKHHNDKELLNQASVLEIKREVMFVPEGKPVDLLFQEMRRQKQQMAVVLDEYGGTSGIVTMEDIFEEIVGEVRDEFDNEEDAIRPTQVPNQYVVECKIHIDDFCDFFDIDKDLIMKEVADHEFDTLAGFILYRFGLIPKAGDKFSIHHVGIEIVEVSKRRVRRVVVRLNE